LVKYSKLYDEVYDHNRYLSSETTAFVNLYYSFLAFRNVRSYHKAATRAVVEFHTQVFPNDWESVELWEEKYNYLKDSLGIFFFKLGLRNESLKEKKYLEISGIKVSTEELIPFLDLEKCWKQYEFWLTQKNNEI